MTEVAILRGRELQSAINHEHCQVLLSAENMVHHVVRCGEMLLQAKEETPHGSWVPWVEEHFDGSLWTAQGYMRMANEERKHPGSITSVGGIAKALKSISAPKRHLESGHVDPDSTVGRMLANARELDQDDVYVDADVVEVAPAGIEERRWNTAWRRIDEVRRFMNEAVSSQLTADATVRALQDASTAARQTAIELEQMATAAQRRT